MAHFARINRDGLVLQVIVVNNGDCLRNGVVDEDKGADFCHALFGGTWVQTFYGGTPRHHYAGIGYTYDSAKDAFIPPPPGPEYTLDENFNWIIAPPLIPQIIKMRQCQLYLYDIEMLEPVNQAVLNMSPKAQIEWNTSDEVWRTSPMVEQMRLMFGWTVEQMDQMFLDAAAL